MVQKQLAPMSVQPRKLELQETPYMKLHKNQIQPKPLMQP